MNDDERNWYLAALKRYIEICPEERDTNERIDGNRFSRWTAEKLIEALQDLPKGEPVYAFRSYCQAREYVGRLGGFWPAPVVHDAAIFVQNRLESYVRGTVQAA